MNGSQIYRDESGHEESASEETQRISNLSKGHIRDTSYMVLTFLLVNIRIAVIVKPTAQIAKSTVLPKAWSAAPANTEAIGIIPCEPMLIRLSTLLSLSFSTLL